MTIRGKRVSPVRLALGLGVAAGLTALALSTWPDAATSGTAAARAITSGPVEPGTAKPADATEAGVVEAVKESFTHALIVDRQLGNPLSQGELRLRPTPGATDPQAASRQAVPSAADRGLRITRDRKNINAHFGSPALVARENHRLNLTMAAYADPDVRVIGDGVSTLAFTSVTVNGNTATIEARAHEWTKSVARQQAGGRWLDASPEADTIWHAKLAKGPTGTWMVAEFIVGFTNGSGP